MPDRQGGSAAKTRDHYADLLRALRDAEAAADKLGAVDVCIELRDLIADVEDNK